MEYVNNIFQSIYQFDVEGYYYIIITITQEYDRQNIYKTNLSSAPCQPGNALDQTKGCLPCPEAAWSEGGLAEACNPCPAGKTVGVGKGVSEQSCQWSEYCYRNYLYRSYRTT